MSFKRFLIFILVGVIALFGIIVFQNARLNDGKLHIVFCDIGQGDGIFIRTPNQTDILVDAGPDNKILSCLSSHMPFWDRDLELAFATHPDADHIGGFSYVLKNYKILSFNTSKKSKGTKVFADIQRLISSQNVPFKFLYQGDLYTLSDGVKIEHLWPSAAYVESDIDGKLDANSFSLVQVLTYGKFKTLLTGDIEYQILDTLFEDSSKIDIFKLPHHGSNTGIDDITFQKIHSKLAIISAGKNNRYHHPHPSVLELLKKYQLSYKRIDQGGEVEVVSDGRSWWLNSAK